MTHKLYKSLLCFWICFLLCGPSVAIGQSLDGKIRMYGIALPKQQVTIRSSIEREVTNLLVLEGQIVKQGDILVELDCREALAKKRIAEVESRAVAVLNNARSELEYARSNLDRIVRLVQQNALPNSEYDDAKLRFQRAQAAVEIERESMLARQARFELADAELQKYYLRAPFDGQVVQVSASPGQTLSLSDEILRLVSLDDFRVELFLPTSQNQQILVGQQYPLQIDAPYDRIVQGTVVYRSPIIDAATGTIRIVFEIDNRQLKLPAGFSVSLAHGDPGFRKTSAMTSSK